MAEAKQITEWKGEALRPKTVFLEEEEVFDTTITPECPEGAEVAVHVARDGADCPAASTYYTPTQAYLLAERIRFAAWVAEQKQLGAPGA